MDAITQYKNDIKNIANGRYTNQIQQLNIKKIHTFFYDKINLKNMKDYFIYITEFNNINESIKKIYHHLNLFEKKYIVLDIFVFKIKDTLNYSENYMCSYFCVKKELYNSDKEKYNKIFSNYLNNTNKIKNLIDKYVKSKKDYLFNLNSIKPSVIDLSKVYNKLALQSVKLNYRLIRNIKKTCSLKKEKSPHISTKKIMADVFADDKLLNYLDTISFKYKRFSKNKYYRKQIYTKNNYAAVFVIDFNNIERANKYAELFKKMNIFTISLNKKINNNICVNSYLDIIRINKGNVCGLITDKKTKWRFENIIKIVDNETMEITEENLKNLFSSHISYLKIFSNLDNINSVKVLTGTFLNFNGTNYFSGGAERYLIDLHKVCSDLGYKLRIYQKANFNFVRKYNDIEVVGISNNTNYTADYEQSLLISKKYEDIAKNTTKLNVYSSFLECITKNVSPSVGISHGVAWDSPDNIYDKKYYGPFQKSGVIESAKKCDKIISVDTNTANYFQTVDYELGNKTNVIPNYVDTNEFHPIVKNNQKKVILYPRRLYAPRGLYMLLDIVDKLLEKHDDIEIRLVGKGFDKDLAKINKKVAKWGTSKIKVYNKPPTLMHEEYKQADITLIPTLYSEGTSLSCLEAMASGNAVIATRIGGLTDLIINNYNGKLIEPNSESLLNAIEDFLNNNSLVETCKKNAIEIAKTFSKTKWESNWKHIINKMSKKVDSINQINLKLLKIYVKNPNSEKLNSIILDYLMEGYLIYVISTNVKYKQSFR